MGVETIIVGVIVAVAAAFALRGAVRSARRKQVCSTCGSSGSCPLVKGTTAADAPGVPCGLEAMARPDEGDPSNS
ncbi:MAG TPA: FeoB-associated Cys-rich membrane protein [Candidatus Krumholzibacteria bacterium]|nr:FeoB-associated Cys-rich membrane protein [Candidatus Krumholzibacteria bacterium]